MSPTPVLPGFPIHLLRGVTHSKGGSAHTACTLSASGGLAWLHLTTVTLQGRAASVHVCKMQRQHLAPVGRFLSI